MIFKLSSRELDRWKKRRDSPPTRTVAALPLQGRLELEVVTCGPLCFKGSSDASHTSRYFGSVDSSEKNHGAAAKAEVGGTERLLRGVLQDPVWLLMADTDDSVRMTYQMPAR